MANNENYQDLMTQGAEIAYNPRSVLNPLHEAAFKLAELGTTKPKSKTRELMNMLLCHGARAFRYSQPQAHIHIHIGAQSGRIPLTMRLR
ncbi:hypothetical protein [Rhizobium sp.]|jgi:hypothetical protein|uniref:hypothetical protein n=1 Tax=Rhizobium sp. TaxID=391 RepID=UPI000E86065E|nr:hypothetical protein [Rhizobium sp.]